jgi:hypothetical protein
MVDAPRVFGRLSGDNHFSEQALRRLLDAHRGLERRTRR